MQKIPFVDLKTLHGSIKDELDAAVAAVMEDCAFVGGKYPGEFEQAFSGYAGTRHCVGVGNGTDALYISLRMLGIGKGDEVIVPANSFIATSEAVTLTGAKVVFADCDEKTYNVSIDSLNSAMTPSTKAVIPVHLYGQPAERCSSFVDRHCADARYPR